MNKISMYILSISFSALIFIFAPLLTYLNNVMELSVGLNEVLGYFLAFIILSTVLSLIFHFLPKKPAKIISSILTVITLILFIEGNFINYKLGVLNGDTVDWRAYRPAFRIEDTLCIISIVLSIIFYKKLYKNIMKISLLVLSLLIVFSGLAFHKQYTTGAFLSKSNLEKQEQNKSNSDILTFSKKDNVLILVLDSYSNDLFEEILESKDGNEIKEGFKDFIWFKNNVGPFPTTVMSVPFIKSGQMYDNKIPRDEFLEKNKKYMLENKFNNRKVLVNGMTYGEKTYKLSTVAKIRFAPIHIKKKLYRANLIYGEKHNDIILYKMLDDMAYIDEPVFKYFHMYGMHAPWRMNKNLTTNYRASYTDTGIGCLKVILKILDNLKKEGVYDNSMIFVIGDHGARRMALTDEYETPLLLVKNYKTTKDSLTIDPYYSSLGDIPNTILSELKMPLNPFGENLFKHKTNGEERVLKHCDYNWKHDSWKKNYLPDFTCYDVKKGQIIKK